MREWPNVLATHRRFDIPRSINIRQQYINLVQKFFNDHSSIESERVRFKIDAEADQKRLDTLSPFPSLQKKMRVMVCPGSKWINKQLPLETLECFLE